MSMKDLRSFLASALKAGAKFETTKPSGTGSYEFRYSATLELEHGGETATLSDDWCGGSVEGECYRQHITYGDLYCRVGRLDGVSRKLLDKIPVKTDEEIEA